MQNIVFLSSREKILQKRVAIEIMQEFLVENICLKKTTFAKICREWMTAENREDEPAK
jgi:hypothetical protein